MSTPQVGDVIATAEELDALPDWSAVADSQGDVAQKLPGGRWFYPDSAPITPAKAAKYGPATLVYLPGQPPRPERVVKAEALREAISDAAVIEAAAREAFWTDDLGGHHKPGGTPHTWENIPDVGRENYRTLIRAILACVADRIERVES